ncbi:MAG: hypothetical protein L6R38_007076 [Xanthoria sp. 2 TBL-2021]|nr:MAG: hypothetical protein L6R38_007076 [Xanthoria sp. 2 TBL-2021]
MASPPHSNLPTPSHDSADTPFRNHNWFQCLTSPLDPIASTSTPLTPLQARRLAFYRSWFALVRSHCGAVTLAYTPSTTYPAPSSAAPDPPLFTTSPSNAIAAVVLLLPPHARPSWFEPLIAWRSGLLPALFGLGLRGIWRVAVTFESNVERMISEGLKARKVAGGDQGNLVMCHGCVRNPQWEGKAPAQRLFDWAIRRWWKRERESGESPTPVWLDTSIDEGVRAYEAIGFEVLGECAVDTGADAKGIKLEPESTEEAKEKARKRSRQWVMLRMPPEEGKSD